MGKEFDAIIVGAGPNGLTAGAFLARAGLRVLILEKYSEPGGGCRSASLTLPGYVHDVCAAIHPMGLASPAFRSLQLEKHGLEWVTGSAAVAHVLEDRSVLLRSSVAETAADLGADASAWRELLEPFLAHPDWLFQEILQPVRIPQHPLLMARFGLAGIRSCESLLRSRFRSPAAAALFAGCAAHSMLPLNQPGSASFGLVLAVAGHALGWPCAKGGSHHLIQALAAFFRACGGEIQTGMEVESWRDLPPARVVLFDTMPRHLARIAVDHLPPSFLRRLERFRYGPGSFKIDWALTAPIPWKDRSAQLAATVHVGGTAQAVMESELRVSQGQLPDPPFVLLAQQSLLDPSRAPAGRHTGWAYCHVPSGCPVDMTEAIEARIEQFAPGFRDCIIARHTRSPAQYEAYNPNFIGGDIGGGSNHLRQFLLGPAGRWDPYSTPNPKIYICSSATPPGGGVHGMCGYWAARSVLRRVFGRELPV